MGEVDIPRRAGGLIELEWLATFGCISPDCGWEILITDAGEPKAFSVSTVSLGLVEEYADSGKGVMSTMYHLFFVLILIVWVGFIFQELCMIYDQFCFIVWYPDMEMLGSMRWRMWLLLVAVLPRLVLCLWVGFVGIVLLVVSREFMEIVLNSVALSFILDVDEILFKITAPVKVQNAMRETNEYSWPSRTFVPQRLMTSNCNMLLHIIAVVALAVAATEFMYHYGEMGFAGKAKAVDCVCSLKGAQCRDAVLH